MSGLTREDLLTIVNVQTDPCLSIYMCTDRLGSQTRQNPIRLRNLLRQAEERLTATPLRNPDVRNLLQPAEELLSDSQFWRRLGDGLALFSAAQFFRVYHLPFSVDEQIVVDNHFYVKPLLPLLGGDGQFYVLALSQGGVRLYKGTSDGISPMELANVPANLNESRQLDEAGGNQQFQSVAQATGGAGGPRGGVFHGTDAAENNLKREILTYFHEVDRGVRDTIRDEQAPLVLAGVEYLLPLYREVNSYPVVIKGEIPTGVDSSEAQDLHERAWRLVEPIFTSDRHKALDALRKLASEGSPKASTSLREVVPAAFYGRVNTLLLDSSAAEWGNFDVKSGKLTGPAAGREVEDLVDLAARFTLQHNGTIYTLNRAEMPASASVGALFRY